MGQYVPKGTGEGLCDLSQAGSNTVVNDWKDWRPDTAIKTGTRCSVKMTGSMTGAVLLTVESVLPGSQVRPSGRMRSRPRGRSKTSSVPRWPKLRAVVRIVPEDALGVVLKQKTPRLSSA